MSLDQMAKIYGCKFEILYPYEYFTLEYYKEVMGNLKKDDLKSSLYNKLTTQREVDLFNKEKREKTGTELTIHYCIGEYVSLSMREFNLNLLHYLSLPSCSWECWLVTGGVVLDTIQDDQMKEDFLMQGEVENVV